MARKARFSPASSSSSSSPSETVPTLLPGGPSSALPSTLSDSGPFPRMLVFDLDYTLWPLWCDTHVVTPLRSDAGGLSIKDATGQKFGFYREVPGILAALRERGILLGAASRTCAPEVAREMLERLCIPGGPGGEDATGKARGKVRAIEAFDRGGAEMYPGSKTGHFKKLRERTGVPFEEMLFFDDESRNRNVEELGVVMQLVRNGVTAAEVDKGVETWRQRRQRRNSHSTE